MVEGGNQVALAGSLDLEDRQNILEEVAHRVGSRDQDRNHQVVVHSLFQTGQVGSSHQNVVEGSLEARMGHHVVVPVEVGPVERHSNRSGKGQLSSGKGHIEIKLGQSFGSEGRQRKSPHGLRIKNRSVFTSEIVHHENGQGVDV